nr:MAG TPA: hypothetical protein [Siphoviridae sp. ctBfm1]
MFDGKLHLNHLPYLKYTLSIVHVLCNYNTF